jgi:hypothetical protein
MIGSGSFMLVAVYEVMKQDCRLNAEPSNGAAGEDLGEED